MALRNIYAQLKGDKMIWVVALMLSIFSILAVYSSTGTLAYKFKSGNTEAYVLKHVLLLGVGWFLMYVAYLIHYTRYSRLAPYLLALSVPLLVFTMFFGADINDAKRWITLPYVGVTFQTSDFAKLALMIYVARAISAKQDYIKDFKSAFVPIIVPVLLICGLIAPADLSSALLLFISCLLLMFMGRVDIKYILLLLVLGVAVFGLLVMIGKTFPDFIRVDTWSSRLRTFLDPNSVPYQIQQSKIAIAEGGLFGVGPGNSIQRNYLPHPYSDFIYSVIIEEYGVIGGFVAIFLYLLLFLRVVSLVTRSPKAFGAMLALGLSLLLVLQALANMAVAVNLVPVTGLTLPMVSMGGTSLLFTCISIGIILSVSKFIETTK